VALEHLGLSPLGPLDRLLGEHRRPQVRAGDGQQRQRRQQGQQHHEPDGGHDGGAAEDQGGGAALLGQLGGILDRVVSLLEVGGRVGHLAVSVQPAEGERGVLHPAAGVDRGVRRLPHHVLVQAAEAHDAGV
jgi:hypothetical protein